MPIQCFMLEPTFHAFRCLRRFTDHEDAPCPLTTWGHDAQVPIEDGDVLLTPEGYWRIHPEEHPRDDPRWPTYCACSYGFNVNDEWQLSGDRIYVRAGTNERYSLKFNSPHAAPAGAMWYAPWFGEPWQGPDGKTLMVRLPSGHDWCVDGPSSSGGGWTRTGTVPNITAMPSIWDRRPNGYHGWLQNGVLTDDLEGRTYA